MWLFLLFPLITADNRAADKLFFGDSKTYRTYLPALPCSSSKNFPTYIRDIPCGYANTTNERIYPLKNTSFRITFNPFRCDTPNHLITIALFNEYESKQGRVANKDDKLKFNVKDYLILKRVTIMGNEHPNEVTYKIFTKNRHPLLIDFSSKGAHIYVKINEGIMNITFFEENSEEIRIHHTMIAKDVDADLHHFTIIASEYHTCPAFISMVDNNFPTYVHGMKWSINGTETAIEWADTTESSYTHMYGAFLSVFVCGVIYMCIVPTLLHLVYPELRFMNQRMLELFEDDETTVTMDMIRAAVATPAIQATDGVDDRDPAELPSKEDESRGTVEVLAPHGKSKRGKVNKRKLLVVTSKAKTTFKKALSKRASAENLLNTQPSDENVYNNIIKQTQEEPTQQANEEVNKGSSVSSKRKNPLLEEEITQQLISVGHAADHSDNKKM